MLRYVGDPFVDCGVATLTVATGAGRPEQINGDRIEAFLDEIRPHYLETYMANFLGNVAFPNINFANVGLNGNPKYIPQRDRQLRFWMAVYSEGAKALDRLDIKERRKIEAADEGELCIFSGEPAIVRVSRILIPMTSDASAPNFAPEGRPRLPISGWCVLALLAMPMGALSSGGRLMVPHTVDYALLQELVAGNLKKNRQEFLLQGLVSRPNYRFARTHIMKELLETRRSQREYPITLYHFSGSEQSAKLDMYQLNMSVLSFINLARSRFPKEWEAVVARAWENQDGENRKANTQKGGEVIEYIQKNHFYEDLFNLPARSVPFLKVYLLRHRVNGKDKGDPRRGYSALREREVISWGLIGLFMEHVMEMSKTRVEAITDLGDRLANYINKHDKRLYGRLYRTRRPDQVRMELIRVASQAKDKGETLLPLELFKQVFFVDEGDFFQPDWYLAMDLLLIRIIQQLSEATIKENEAEIEKADLERQQNNED